MWEKSQPLVSIGLPVFNGENFLRNALDSILAQTFHDYEILICDNASEDSTQEIAESYARIDPRISYHRNRTNLGAAPNYNSAFERSQGKYFKWHAHDDEMEAEYLEKMVAVLEADENVVLAHSRINLINETGESLDIHDSELTAASSESTAERFGCLILQAHQCLELDGVIRSSLLAGTELIGAFHGSDRALLGELSLRGRFVLVEEPLFKTREHPQRYRRVMKNPEDRLNFHTTASQQQDVSTWTMYKSYGHAVQRHVNQRSDRIACQGKLLVWWFVNWNFARLAVDILAVAFPRVLPWAEQIKQRIFTPEPGPDARSGAPTTEPGERNGAR